jgi:multicomponent Na+:H+ antiporter subunit G
VTWSAVADVAAAACLVLGALLALIAAVGILRFPDVLTRMHSATKPQVLGLLLVLLGLGLRLRDLLVVDELSDVLHPAEEPPRPGT